MGPAYALILPPGGSRLRAHFQLERADAAVAALVVRQRLAAWSTLGGYVRYMATGAAHCAVKGSPLSDFAANAARYAARARKAAEGVEEGKAQAQLVRDATYSATRSLGSILTCNGLADPVIKYALKISLILSSSFPEILPPLHDRA